MGVTYNRTACCHRAAATNPSWDAVLLALGASYVGGAREGGSTAQQAAPGRSASSRAPWREAGRSRRVPRVVPGFAGRFARESRDRRGPPTGTAAIGWESTSATAAVASRCRGLAGRGGGTPGRRYLQLLMVFVDVGCGGGGSAGGGRGVGCQCVARFACARPVGMVKVLPY